MSALTLFKRRNRNCRGTSLSARHVNTTANKTSNSQQPNMMQQDVARHLLFSATTHHPNESGLNAQLHALRLKCALQAETLLQQQQQQHQPSNNPHLLLSDLSSECSRLLLAAGATQQAVEARCVNIALTQLLFWPADTDCLDSSSHPLDMLTCSH